MANLDDRVVVVTGASGNLGQAGAIAFVAAGARVVLVDRSQERLEQCFPELVGSERSLLLGDIDLTDEPSVRQLVGRAVSRFGKVDALFHTVGVYKGGVSTLEESPSTWDFLMTVNLRTTLLLARAVLPPMLAQGSGSLVFTASRAGFRGESGAAAYSASKAAVLRLGESLAEEVREAGINVNCLVPGVIDTPQNRAAMPDADHSSWTSPGAIADVAVFLASGAARAVSGAAIPVGDQG